MDPRVCVICFNKKQPNRTDNRLVTESCGHVKCMECLLQEKAGCSACATEKVQKEFEGSLVPEIALTVDNGSVHTGNDKEEQDPLCVEKKIVKPETSHIKLETDAAGNKLYVCVCGKKFRARSQVAYHAYCNGHQKPYQCPECSKSFATHSHFKYHMRVHRNERTYACEECGEGFFQMSKLQRHKLKHTMEKKHVCPQCNKAFNNPTSLRKHAFTHTEEKPYCCKVCDRRFRDSSNYKKHLAKHQEKQCMCIECGRAVGSQRALVAHARAHVSQRAYQCPRCPQAFHSNKDMRRHLQVHTDSKPFRCKVCNRRFRRKDNLDRHIRNTHPEYAPAAAAECDENELKQITNGHSNQPTEKKDKIYETHEKNKLEILNPLPPLPKELIQKHMYNDKDQDVERTSPVIDKSYILEANIARQSVIVAKCSSERKVDSPIPYVHKMRRANYTRCHDATLPPIDQRQLIEFEKKNSFDIGDPVTNMEIKNLQKILKVGKEKEVGEHDVESKVNESSSGHEVHYRRKWKLNINCSYLKYKVYSAIVEKAYDDVNAQTDGPGIAKTTLCRLSYVSFKPAIGESLQDGEKQGPRLWVAEPVEGLPVSGVMYTLP